MDCTPYSPTNVIVNYNEVIIEHGPDRIIVPRRDWDLKNSIRNSKAIKSHISTAFGILSEDISVTDFGIAASMDVSVAPVGIIDQTGFREIVKSYGKEDEQIDVPFIDEITKVTVLKIVFERGYRKWQFVWNGIKISAPIVSDAFFDKLASHEYEFAQGDVLDITLRIHRARDEFSGALINSAYEVIEVHGLEKMPRRTSFLRSPKPQEH